MLACERHPKSVRTVWGVGAASRVSTSGSAGSAAERRRPMSNPAPALASRVGSSPERVHKSSYLSVFCSVMSLKIQLPFSFDIARGQKYSSNEPSWPFLKPSFSPIIIFLKKEKKRIENERILIENERILIENQKILIEMKGF